MSNIVQFPKSSQITEGVSAGPVVNSDDSAKRPGRIYRAGRGILRFLWLLLVLFWPLLRLVVIADVTFQMFRMIYYWSSPEMNAGWVFLGHFSVLTLLTYLVASYPADDVLAAKKVDRKGNV